MFEVYCEGDVLQSKTIIISDRLFVPEQVSMDLYEWRSSRPSTEGYNTVILDLYFGLPSAGGYRGLKREDAHFYELGIEIAKSLRAGGVVIALLGPLTVTQRSLQTAYTEELYRCKREGTYMYVSKYNGYEETSYDWLDQGFLKETEIDTMFAKKSEGVIPLSVGDELIGYMKEWGGEYWVTINGIEMVDENNMGIITHSVAQQQRWNLGRVAQYPVKILGIGAHTKLPVAVALKYMSWDGVLVLLPPCRNPDEGQGVTVQDVEMEMGRLLRNLENIAKRIKKNFEVSTATVHEDWVYEHRPEKAKSIIKGIKLIKKKEEELLVKLKVMDEMLVLIDGTGDELVKGVVSLFDKKEERLRVEQTEKGASIDLFVHDEEKGRKLVVEVTGITGILKKKMTLIGVISWATCQNIMRGMRKEGLKG